LDKTFIQKIKDKHVYIALSICGFLLYFRSLFSGFTYLDDNVLILKNIDFLRYFYNIFGSFFTEVFHTFGHSAAYYRPLLTISFMPEAMFFGTSPLAYHFVNIVLHLIAASLVFKFFCKLNYSKIIAFVFSGIFLVHPALAQAVAWVPGRNDSLLAIFALSSLVFFINFFREQKRAYAVWSIIFFLSALFTKENAIVLPVIYLMLALISGFSIKKIIKEFAPWWAVCLAVWLAFRHMALPNPVQFSLNEAFMSLFFNLPALPQMLGKIFFPFNLSVFPIIKDTAFVFGALAFLVLVFVAVLQTLDKSALKKSHYMMAFGIAWFLLFLLPAFVRPSADIVADFLEHRLYLPLIGIFIFLAESAMWKKLQAKYIIIFVFIVLAGFSVINFMHQANFYDKISFWKNAAENSPNSSLAQKNLGAMYYLDGDYDFALQQYQKALTLSQYETMVHNNIGLVYANTGRFEEAEQEYLEELSFNPYYDDAHFNLGLLYYKMERFEEAEQEWQKTLQINPYHAGAEQALNALR